MEILLEIIGEILFEIILTGIVKAISIFFIKINTDNILRRNLELSLTYIFIGLISLLIILSIMNSQTILVIISLSYLLLQIVFSFFDIVNQGINKNFILVMVKIFKTICHYAFPTLVIVFGFLHIENQSAINILIVVSSVVLLVSLIIDVNRTVRYFKKPKKIEPTFKRENQLFDNIKI